MWLLHVWPDHVGRGAASRTLWHIGRRCARIHERQYLPLRRLPEYRQGNSAGAARGRRKLTMQAFDIVRAPDRQTAVTEGAASPTAQQGASVRFLAGGTTLVD